jgi:hypothetical protein
VQKGLVQEEQVPEEQVEPKESQVEEEQVGGDLEEANHVDLKPDRQLEGLQVGWGTGQKKIRL